MSGAHFVLIINMTVAGLFAIAFLGIAVYEKTYISARLFALAFVFAMMNFGSELLVPAISNPKLGYMLAFTTFLCTLICVTIGMAHKYAVRIPWLALTVLSVASLVMVYSIYDIARVTLLGMLLYQAPYFVALCFSSYIILKSRARGIADMLLFALLFVSAGHFLLKPFIAIASGGMGQNPQDYIHTQYALFSQTIGAALSVANGLLMLVILTRDLMADMSSRSETDMLSRLLNRRGFEVRSEAAIGQARRSGLPLSLIVCDLDNFKTINDGYGHELGDHVIRAFAAGLREIASDRDIVARIGGEEFAILLPGMGIHAGRLFAEKARSNFSGRPVAGLPPESRFTASFGVAELQDEDALSDLMRRADNALYDAKKSGRNCVRLAPPVAGEDKVVELRLPPGGRFG
ncbi:GGDEF domain-containing protein [Mesorhizobium sp. RMAD-H1]|uniref:GGDEF domain-containing protein n=1 Tax=Mesorhizobium sp. RMAD-H1 TaxID=2587065 RepID=UPI00160F3B97|nr:GGDEF domain-containing protein [Mesorhizobium sp. RMAD-H1]MBB2972551.1 diguanylate cyclase (GGDEF)-like protein [Mesorhizobium sp. RMAD-H1]